MWQRRHSVKSLRELRAVLGGFLPDDLASDIERDQEEMATMPLLVTPQMINTMNERDLWNDPVRRYMLPAFRDRHPEWPSHPLAVRDSLHEADMWAVEGLTHRYPTKALALLLATCPMYCGHCTRMDLVGSSTVRWRKRALRAPPRRRHEDMLEYLSRTPSIRDVVVSGGDIANLPVSRLEDFVDALLELPNIRDIRLDSKALIGLPQHFLRGDVLSSLERLARKARQRGVDLAVHTHANCAEQVTPLVAKAARELLALGLRDVRNQGVLLRGINASAEALLDLCLALLDRAKIMPYYFYLCEMIPNAEHWRLSVRAAETLQHDLMGRLPGFAVPRLVCDVPFAGKLWVYQWDRYDREKGISYWSKNYRTRVESEDSEALTRRYEYYDPVHTLPPGGQDYWRRRSSGAV